MKKAFCALALLAASACASLPEPDHSPTIEAPLPGGAAWSAIVPEHWNGTLLLHSRGYAPVAGKPEPAPLQYSDLLLAKGYALAASNYGSGGWALAEAVPAQQATIAAFARRYGRPERVIAYGFSMGGLVTTALAEVPDPPIDGALSLCSSMGGAVSMMNMGLDGAYVFRTLLAPQSDIALVGVANDRANAALVQQVAQEAKSTPAGRARMVLAATLGGIPAWVPEVRGESPAATRKRQVEALLTAIPMGIFLPRAEQEQRAGVGYSSNEGIDYAALLGRSGRGDFVRSVYRDADLDLKRDLSALEQGPRARSEQSAVGYMTANYEPTAQPSVPIVAVQALGDVITSPSLQESYAERAPANRLLSLYLPQSGHCTFTADQILTALHIIEQKLDSGAWQIPPDVFSSQRPSPMPRSRD